MALRLAGLLVELVVIGAVLFCMGVASWFIAGAVTSTLLERAVVIIGIWGLASQGGGGGD